MKSSRSHLGLLMALVGVVGIDLAVSRSFLNNVSESFWFDLGRYVLVAPMAVILQFAAFRAVSGRGTRRVFWAGFLAFGLVAISTVILAVADHYRTTTRSSASGMTTEVYPGGPASRAWEGYYSLACAGLVRLHYPLSGGKVYYWTLAVLIFLPQLVFAWTGGHLARRIMNRIRPTIGLRSPPREDGPAPSRGHPLP